jgi:hypothetical protein
MLSIATVALAAVVQPADRVVFVEPGIGYVRSVDRAGGYFGTTTLGYAALARFFAIGGHIDTKTNFDYGSYALGASAGGQWFLTDRLRIAALGEVGVHLYAAGTTFGSLGYGGGRFIAATHLGSSGRVHLAAHVIYRHDFGQKQLEYQKTSFNFGAASEPNRVTVGEGTLGVMIAVGVSF